MLWNCPDRIARDRAIYRARTVEKRGWFWIASEYRVTVTQAMRIVGREKAR